MVKRARLLLGISVFWLALSMLFDGLNSLVLPNQVSSMAGGAGRATTLGLLTFGGILLGMLVQPLAGLLSDRLYPRWGRHGTLAAGVLLLLLFLPVLGAARSLLALAAGYLLIQVAASLAQAAQQGFIPDLVPAEQRGMASGFKGLMDVGGAAVGFVVLGQLLQNGQAQRAVWAIAAAVLLAFVLTVVLLRDPRPAFPSRRQPGAPLSPGHWTAAFRVDLGGHRVFARVVLARFLFLLGTYGVGRFLLFFVTDRLHLEAGRAAQETGLLLAGLTLVTALAAPLMGWASDRWGRVRLMAAGAVLSTIGVLLLIGAASGLQILLFGSLMSAGSAAFAGANWALTTELAPQHEAARFMALANFGTAGAAAAAGLFGPFVDWAGSTRPGSEYAALFSLCALAFLASVYALRGIGTPAPLPRGAGQG